MIRRIRNIVVSVLKFLDQKRAMLSALSSRLIGRNVRSSKPFEYINRQIVSRGLKGLIVGVPKETSSGEHRVAIVPGNVTKLTKAGATVIVEQNAGTLSGFTDEQVTYS